MKKKKTSIFDDNLFLAVVSLIIAILGWFIVRTAIDTDSKVIKKGIPVSIDVEGSVLGSLGLSVIQEKQEYVNVEVQGETYILGNLENDDIKVRAQLSNISSPGVYDLRLEGMDVKNKGFKVISIKPETIKIKVDRLTTKHLPVELNLSGVTIPQGYYLENETISPAEVVITGPEIDVAKVSRAVVDLELNYTLEKTETTKGKIELLDKEGNIVDTSHINLDANSADVTIPVLKTKEVPVKVSFLNVPKNFPIDELYYQLSNETITVAGPVDSIDNYTEINLGYVDIKELNTQSIFSYDVSLMPGFVNIENIENVVVDFDMTDMSSKKFTVDNFRIINPPAKYDIEVITSKLNNVNMVGEYDILDTMTADDIVAEIDVSNLDFVVGNIKVPVTIYAPSKGLVWANGNYQVIVSISEKDKDGE